MTRSFASRGWRALRSRRLAAWLIGILVAYSAIGTLVPQGQKSVARVAAWGRAHPVLESLVSFLGLHDAYQTPFFIGLFVLLTLCTAACATERTSRAFRLYRAIREPSTSAFDRVVRQPQRTARAREGLTDSESLSAAEVALRRVGLKTRRAEGGLDGYSGVLGLFGSPLFHWCIVALILVVAAGQATRAEGFLGLPLGTRVVDRQGSYLQVREGPLFGNRYSGLEFVAVDLDRHYVVDGIDREATPLVKAYRSGLEVASGRVYPNHPLRIGRLLVHMADFGPEATLALETSAGAETARDTFLLDRSTATSSGTEPEEFVLAGAGTADVAVRIQVITRSDVVPAGQSQAVVETAVAGSGDFGAQTPLSEGQALEMPGGQRLRLAEVGDWVRVSVANDWSVPYIYAVLAIAVAAMSVALLVPTRRVTVVVARGAGGHTLHWSTWQSSAGSVFRERVAGALRTSQGMEEVE